MVTILRLPEVLAKRGKKRSTHYDDIRKRLFTSPVKLGVRQAGWPEHEVAAINAALIAGRSEADIKQLVAQLEAARKEAA